jgi:hypothetical protein
MPATGWMWPGGSVLSDLPNVVIVGARCTRSSQHFGIRFEESDPEHWTADWAFAVREASARKEGYDQGQITELSVFPVSIPVALIAVPQACSSAPVQRSLAGTETAGK